MEPCATPELGSPRGRLLAEFVTPPALMAGCWASPCVEQKKRNAANTDRLFMTRSLRAGVPGLSRILVAHGTRIVTTDDPLFYYSISRATRVWCGANEPHRSVPAFVSRPCGRATKAG